MTLVCFFWCCVKMLTKSNVERKGLISVVFSPSLGEALVGSNAATAFSGLYIVQARLPRDGIHCSGMDFFTCHSTKRMPLRQHTSWRHSLS